MAAGCPGPACLGPRAAQASSRSVCVGCQPLDVQTLGDPQRMRAPKKYLLGILCRRRNVFRAHAALGSGEQAAMKRIVVRYKTKPEAAEANAQLIAQVFAELKQKAPAGVRYLALRLQDDTFLHVSVLESEDGTSPIPQLAAFRAFQSGLKERCLEPPQPSNATLIGSYRVLDEA